MIKNLQKKPKVLIISVNPIDENTNNGKTIISFFDKFNSSSIYQLFFHRNSPNTNRVSQFYRISDEDIINFILKKEPNLGHVAYNGKLQNFLLSKKFTNLIRNSYFFKLLRLLLFTIAPIKNTKLENWLDSLRPDVIFLCAGDANFLYPIAKWISKKYNIKIINFITDDYLIFHFSLNPFYLIHRLWTNIAFNKIAKYSLTSNFTIGQQMTDYYLERFNIKSKPLMNLVNINHFQNFNPNKEISKIVYIGAIHTNRWKVLIEFIKALKRSTLDYSFHIYTFDNIPLKLERFIERNEFVKFHGSINGKEVLDKLIEFDILLHVEAFDQPSQNVTFLSISTKIPEYLSTGKTIFAIGPSKVASMKYLHENQVAITCFAMSDINNQLLKLTDKKLMVLLNQNAFNLVKKNHDIDNLAKEFSEFLIRNSTK
jgi:hypothetical protein